MTEHEQRVAIAEWMGWKRPVQGTVLWTYDGARQWADADHLPNFAHDLNTMREAEMRLAEDARLDYLERLANTCEFTHPYKRDWFCATTPASVRAEALLHTLNLWRDKPPKP